MQCIAIEKPPRTSDAHIYIGTLADGRRERVMCWPHDDLTEADIQERVRAEIERRVAAHG